MADKYTLADYFAAADFYEFPDWFHEVTLRRTPWPHQVEDLKFCLQYTRFGLFNDAGVGKTLPMQALLVLYTAGYGNRGVVCMPPSLIGQFMEGFYHAEESYFIGLAKFINFRALVGTKKKKDGMWHRWEVTGKWPELLVMSYQAFSNLHPLKPQKEKIIHNQRTGTSYVRPAVKPLREHPLKKLDYNTLFFDEAQALKNVGSGIAKKVWRYVGSRKDDFFLGLFTGSPIANTLEDAYGMIHLITPGVYNSQRHFQKTHCIYTQGNDGFKQLIGYQAIDLMNERIYAQARRVTKQEVLPDLPPMIPEAVVVNLSPTHMHWYKKLINERVLELPDEFIDATQQQKLRQVAMQMITTPEKYIPKKVENYLFDAFNEKVLSIDPTVNKIIVFAYYKTSVDYLANRYEKYNPAVINGGSGDKEKARLKFRDDESCRMIIINWLSGGAGLNLQISSHLLFYETPSVPSQALQAIARSHRGGQDKPVNVFFFRVMATLMAKSLKQLLKKDHDVNLVIRDKHKMLHELLGVSFS